MNLPASKHNVPPPEPEQGTEHRTDAGDFAVVANGLGKRFDIYNSDQPALEQQASFYVASGLGLFIYTANVVGAYNGAVRANSVNGRRYRERFFSEPTPRPGDPGHPIAQ